MAELTLRIEKMSCGSCIRHVTQTLNAQPATHASEVRLGMARVETSAPPEELLRALDEAGYPAHVDAEAA